MIEVRLFATLREGRGKILFFEKEDFSIASDILKKLQIPEEEVAIYLINGFHASLDAPVEDGDVLALFPPVGGG